MGVAPLGTTNQAEGRESTRIVDWARFLTPLLLSAGLLWLAVKAQTQLPAPQKRMPDRSDPWDQRRIAVYQVSADHYISGNEIQWTLLYYYLVGCSILALAWASVFGSLPSRPHIAHDAVLSILSVAGIVLSVIWLALQRRSSSYMPILFEAAREAEAKVEVDVSGSMARVREHRGGLTDGFTTTRRVVTLVPFCFLIVFVVLLIVGLWPHVRYEA